MSKVTRKLIRSETYEGHRLEARFMGPDLLAYVGEAGGIPVELGSFCVASGGPCFYVADLIVNSCRSSRAAVYGKDGQVLVTIDLTTGRAVLKGRPNEAARTFWKAVEFLGGCQKDSQK